MSVKIIIAQKKNSNYKYNANTYELIFKFSNDHHVIFIAIIQLLITNKEYFFRFIYRFVDNNYGIIFGNYLEPR